MFLSLIQQQQKKRREAKISRLTFYVRKVTLSLESGIIRQGHQTVLDPDPEHIMYGVLYCTLVQVEEIYDLQREPLVENKTCYGAIFLFR